MTFFADASGRLERAVEPTGVSDDTVERLPHPSPRALRRIDEAVRARGSVETFGPRA